MAEAKSEDLWNPYRDLYESVNKYITSKESNAYSYTEFETLLRKYRQSFFSLLTNLPKNAASREELRKGHEEGIAVKGVGHQMLSKELYQELVIISDMYEMNEYVALDLLCTAQMEIPFFPDLPRGLVAIILYYDARKYLVSTLRILLQARSGVCWSLNLPPPVQKFINNYMDQLFDNGLFTQILDLLKKLDVSKEMEMLQSNLALGGPKHRKQVTDNFNSIKLLLADCLYLWSAQSGLSKSNTMALIKHLKEVKLEEDASGKVDDVTLYLMMALLYAVDLSILHVQEDGEEIVQKLPILSEAGFVDAILKELSPNNAGSSWACMGLQSLATFGAAVCLSSLRMVPQGQKYQNILDYEDELVDAAIAMKVFEFLHQKFLVSRQFFDEEVMIKRIHNLFCDFIVQMFPKVKELRIKADETARTIQAYVHEGLEIPQNLPRYFENLLLAIAMLYGKDPMNLRLMMDYWCPSDGSQNLTHYRAHPRSVSLFKFVRLAGDLLPASLFVNYLTLLSSLSNCQQGARNCFNMLKQPSGLNSSISWDHFFASFNQYYANLKLEVPSNTENFYRHSRLYNKGITPQEIDGLRAVLKLLITVSDQDEFSRMALCEHPGWAPLTVLLGLVSCSIPIPLKADILLAMASLSKSKEIAVRMWNNLEASQILVTIPSTSSYQPRGIQTELDEIESRLEEYPLTRAFLKLVDTLTNFGISRTLGAGSRQPGFDPYLVFIVNSVFLKFNSRNYKNPAEQWEIAAICLKMLSKFLDQYEPDPGDFQSNKPNDLNSPPGFHIMLQLHSKSELFNGILFVVDEICRLKESYLPGDEKFISTASYYALSIINRCLKLQSSFFTLLSNSNWPALLVNMHKLLLSLNPRTGRPDYVITLMKYLRHLKELPRQNLLCAQILAALVTSPVTHTQIVNILLSSNEEKSILYGFVYSLDETLNEEGDYPSLVKKEIFNLMQQCLPYNAPNLTHYLFGFDLQRDVSSTVFQFAGILNTTRTCMHSLLTMLRQILIGRLEEDQSVVESCYKMLYALCSNRSTAEPVLRLLRTQNQFFKRHLKYCGRQFRNGVHELNQLSWLLKTLAIELRMASSNKQIVNLKQLTCVLVGLPPDAREKADCFAVMHSSTEPSTEEYIMTVEQLKQDNFLVQILNDFDLNIPACEAPQWGFFEQNSLESYLAGCQTQSSPKLIDIKKLHRNLLEEVTAAQGTAALGQRQAMLDEIQRVLLHALSINKNRSLATSSIEFIDSWRQVVETFVIYVPIEIIAPKEQVLLEIYLLETILKKCVKSVLLPEVGTYLSGAIVILVEHLRKSHLRDLKMNQMLRRSGETDERTMIESNMSSIQTILDSLVEWIILSDNQSQKLRTNLYSSFAIFLQLIRVADFSKDAKMDDSNYVSRLDSSKLKVNDELSAFCISSNVLASFGEKLVNVLCYDCTSGSDISKMLATSCFGLLLNLSGNVTWIAYLSGRGYLKHIMDSILKSDMDLRKILEPAPLNYKNLFLYNSKMAFLNQIANSRMGAELLLEHKLLSSLSAMKVFDFHPDLRPYTQDEEIEDFVAIPKRYGQIWEPTLYLCHAILTSLGTDHHAANTQIMNFLLRNLDILEIVLRAAAPTLNADSLREVSLVTGLLARTAENINFLSGQFDNDSPDYCAQLCRIQKLMLNLLPKFVLSESVLRELLCDSINDKACYRTSDRLSYAFEIVANLLHYCRNITKNNGIEHNSIGVVLQPHLDSTNGNSATRHFSDHNPSIGVVIQQLIHGVSFYHKERNTLEFLNRKEAEICNLDAADLKEFGVETAFDINIMREDALQVVSDKLKMKNHDIKNCLLIVDHSMYIVWSHLDHYMLKTIPRTKSFGPNSLDATIPNSVEAMWKITVEEISHLKQGLVSIFNDTFCRQILETSQGRSDADSGFMEALLRKVKRLIQFVPIN